MFKAANLWYISTIKISNISLEKLIMDVNRKYKRCHLTGKGEIATSSGVLEFKIENLSAAGASIYMDAELNSGVTYDAKFFYKVILLK